MPEPNSRCFAQFRLDLANECVWRGTEEVVLRPKSFAVLRHLVEHSGRLVTKDELLQAVWSGVAIGDAGLTVCVQEIRQALGDDRRAPRFIQTVHRRGYRFIAPLTSAQPVASSQYPVVSGKSVVGSPQPTTGNWQLTTPLVGREIELAQLHERLKKALRGERQVILVGGETGIGKTTVVKTFLQQVATEQELWLAQGQCLEQYGVGEPYLPVLSALGRLCRESGKERLLTLLSQYAPTWLAQMPALLSAAELAALQPKLQGTTRERMLREMAEAVEALTAEQPFVLWLEDLHWSDYSTLDLISLLARRQGPARLLIIGTYRPVEVIVSGHPLKAVKQELLQHGYCEELRLDTLSEAAVAEYLAARFPSGAVNKTRWHNLVRTLYRRTDGHPFFLASMVDYFVQQGLIVSTDEGWEAQGEREKVQRAMPTSLRQMIEQQIDRLSGAEQEVLEAASIAGLEFSAVEVASALAEEVIAVERRCEALARQGQFLSAKEMERWPDGTPGTRYNFLHVLYQDVLYQRVPAARRAHFHQRIGERLETAYRNRTGEIAALLATHFEHGQDYRRAVLYLRGAAEHATRLSAYREAIDLLMKGLELLATLPDTAKRAQQELRLQLALGVPLMATKGYAAPEVARVYARARALCQQIEETPQLFPILSGLFGFYVVRGDLRQAHELALRCLHLAQSAQDPVFLAEAHRIVGSSFFYLGEFSAAHAHSQQAIAHADPQNSRSRGIPSGLDPAVAARSYAAWSLQLLGFSDQALRRNEEALALARELSHANTLAQVLNFAAAFHGLRREWQAAQTRAEEAITLATEYGLRFYAALGTFYKGWALTEQGQSDAGIPQMREGITAYQATGAEVGLSGSLYALAEVQRKTGQVEEGLRTLSAAFVAAHKSGEPTYEAELYRIKGELMLTQSSVQRLAPSVQKQIEENFQNALEIARRQSAKWWELRAVMSLSRLWHQRGKTAEARQRLAETYGWFTEGFDTADLREAKALREELEAAITPQKKRPDREKRAARTRK